MPKDLGGFQKAPTLLDAVDAITKVQHVRENVGESIFERADEPLLDLLYNAIRSNIGGNGGGKQARERTPLDVGAFQLYETIDSRIRAWLLDLGQRPAKDATARNMLRTWYRLWLANSSFEKYYQSVIEGWEQQIKDKLDPPKRIEISAPCPACGKEFVNIGLKLADGSDDPNDVERVRVLNAVERENIADSYVLCSACERVWTGVPELRQLRIWIDDREEAKRKATT